MSSRLVQQLNWPHHALIFNQLSMAKQNGNKHRLLLTRATVLGWHAVLTMPSQKIRTMRPRVGPAVSLIVAPFFAPHVFQLILDVYAARVSSACSAVPSIFARAGERRMPLFCQSR